jgi:uncharacterized protein (DUF362 family)
MKASSQMAAFDKAMTDILSADPKAVKAAMEAEKLANAEKRKSKKPSASGRASSAKD